MRAARSILLARAASRKREISIRLAMGAGRGRLMRRFLAESFVLASLGGSTGLMLAHWFSAALVTMMANGSKLLLSIAPDWRVLVFTGPFRCSPARWQGWRPDGTHCEPI